MHREQIDYIQHIKIYIKHYLLNKHVISVKMATLLIK